MNIDVSVKLTGMEAVEEKLTAAETAMNDLRKSVAELYTALSEVGLEISQPSADTDD